MTLRKAFFAAFLCLATLAVVSLPVMADEPEEEEAPTPPPPPRPQPPPPAPRFEPPPPTPPRPAPPAPAPPVIEEASEWDSGFTLEPELLYMRFSEPDFDFAATGPALGPFEVESVDHDRDLGGRLGLGYRWKNRWDLMFRGTHIDNDDREEADDGEGELLTVRSFANGSADFAEAQLDTELEYVDGEVGYTWGEREGSNLRLFFGLRVAAFDQDADVLYEGEDSDTNLVSLRNDVDAWGGRVGLEGHVWLGSGWTFIAEGAAAAMTGDFDVMRFETDDDGTTLVTDLEDDFDDELWALEGRLGFGWMHFADEWAWGIEFGWEGQIWEDLARGIDISKDDEFEDGDDDDFDFDDDDDGDELEIDGPFVRLRFLF